MFLFWAIDFPPVVIIITNKKKNPPVKNSCISTSVKIFKYVKSCWWIDPHRTEVLMNTGVSGLYIDISSLFSLVQENLIRDDNKIILLASLSDSLEYVADSIER